ncbi:MAG TPA: hypothetical protein VM755_16570 [Stellaceae bacterium]|nr:hypothetical protein [Stellaceae bacterium]
MGDVEHNVISEDAQPHAFAKLWAKRSRFGESEQISAMLPKLADEGSRAHRVASRNVVADLLKVGFSAPAEA